MNLNVIAALFDYTWEDETPITGVSIDSRSVQPGYLFIALSGARVDGHDFIPEAVAKGAIAVICTRKIPGVNAIQWQVSDPIHALTRLASFHNQTLSCKKIAVTGSTGKTSVKEMIARMLPKPAYATVGNLNNHLGVPLTLLQLKPHHRFAVLELGASHLGEIAHTAALVQPDVALVNNIAPAHIGEFGSMENIAAAKGEIYQSLPAHGIAVLNQDEPFASSWQSLLQDKKVVTFSLNQKTDCYAYDLTFDPQGCAHFTLVTPLGESKIHLRVPGKHMVHNALAAAACCFAADVPLSHMTEGLVSFQGVPGRMMVLNGKNNAVIIDDTYNANLHSVLAAIKVLAQLPGQRILVLGDMVELGEWSCSHHEEVGRVAKLEGIDQLFTYGHHSALSAQHFGKAGRHYATHDALAQALLPLLDSKTTVLVKGSRKSCMEKIVQQLIVQ